MEAKRSENSKEKLPPGRGVNPPSFWWIYLFVAFFLIGQVLLSSKGFVAKETNWQEIENTMLKEGAVAKIAVVNKEKVEIYLKKELITPEKYPDFNSNYNGPHYYFTIGSIEVLESKLQLARAAFGKENVPEAVYITRTNWLRNILGWLLPFFIIVVLWIFIMGRVSSGGMGSGNFFDFGKSKAVVFDAENRSQVTFDDIAGLEEAKVEVQEIVTFLKAPERFTVLGGKIPKGVMIMGPPGTGKTLLAKAVAGEAQVPFFHISGSAFVEMFVGVGASRVRDLFKKAKEKAPSIIFIDEIDAIGRARGGAFSLRANDERESTLNQLLTELDGFDTNSGVIVMAATNRPDILDKALLRPGRFDRHILLELPNIKGRKAIFLVYLKKLLLADDIDVELLAAQTPGFSGADIANICNEAALIAARQQKNAIGMTDFIAATDRVIGGLEQKSKFISPAEKEIIAFHEAGHATVGWYLQHTDDLMKVSIVPRGKSLGAAWYLPQEKHLYTQNQLFERLCTAFGGRAAEDLIFGEVTSGALDDLEKATKQAYTMIAFYGLNEEIGNLSYYDSTGQSEQSFQKPYSEATAQLIDEEVRKLLDKAYKKALSILKQHTNELHKLAERLLEKEVVLQAELQQIFGERKVPTKVQTEDQPAKDDSIIKEERTKLKI